MKFTGYRDINGNRLFVGDTVYSPEYGEFKIDYRYDFGGLVMCEADEARAPAPSPEAFHDLNFLDGKNFSRVGGGGDSADEISRNIVAVIARKQC